MIRAETGKKWHVVYTRSRAEKKVHAEFLAKGIESFLPLQKQLRQWNDRKRWVEVPILRGYCFVHITHKEHLEVLHTEHVLSFVYFDKKAAVVPERDIESLRQMLRQTDIEVRVSTDNFKPGEKVEIIKSPLVGVQGELIKAHGKQRFFIRLNSINTVIYADVPADILTVINSPAC